MRFGLIRLLIAVAIFAPPLAWTRNNGALGILVSLLAAVPIAGLVLFAKAADFPRIVVSVTGSITGALIAVLFMPTIRPPYEVGDEYRYMMVGAVIGWLIACGISRTDRRLREISKPVQRQP